MIDSVGIVRSVVGSRGWLLLQRENDRWSMAATPRTSLEKVVEDAMGILEDRDFSFSDTPLRKGFGFPETPAELNRMTNTTVSIMAPEGDEKDPIWSVLVRDFTGGMSRGFEKFRTQSRKDAIDKWFNDRRQGGGLASFNQPGLLPYGRSLLVRKHWRLRSVAPELWQAAA